MAWDYLGMMIVFWYAIIVLASKNQSRYDPYHAVFLPNTNVSESLRNVSIQTICKTISDINIQININSLDNRDNKHCCFGFRFGNKKRWKPYHSGSALLTPAWITLAIHVDDSQLENVQSTGIIAMWKLAAPTVWPRWWSVWCQSLTVRPTDTNNPFQRTLHRILLSDVCPYTELTYCNTHWNTYWKSLYHIMWCDMANMSYSRLPFS